MIHPPNLSEIHFPTCDSTPIAYFSENLNDAKRKYYVYDQEYYAIVQALKKWRHYILPTEFVLYTDNQSL